MNRELDGIARQSVPGLVRTADGLPRMHTVHSGNVAETKTLQGMLATVLAHVPIQRVILVADRRLPSLDNCPSGAIGSSPMGGGDLTALADQGDRRPEFILVVPAWRYGDLIETFRNLAFDGEGLSESTCVGHRPIVAHDPLRGAEQAERRSARIAALDAIAGKMVGKLDARDDGQPARRSRASDRRACSRFTRAATEAELKRLRMPAPASRAC